MCRVVVEEERVLAAANRCLRSRRRLRRRRREEGGNAVLYRRRTTALDHPTTSAIGEEDGTIQDSARSKLPRNRATTATRRTKDGIVKKRRRRCRPTEHHQQPIIRIEAPPLVDRYRRRSRTIVVVNKEGPHDGGSLVEPDSLQNPVNYL